MRQPLMRCFANLEDGQRARQRLIVGGLPESDIELHSLADEAGAPKGNFAVGDGKPARGWQDAYELNFANVPGTGAGILIVHTDDDELRARVAAMLDAMGAQPGGAP